MAKNRGDFGPPTSVHPAENMILLVTELIERDTSNVRVGCTKAVSGNKHRHVRVWLRPRLGSGGHRGWLPRGTQLFPQSCSQLRKIPHVLEHCLRLAQALLAVGGQLTLGALPPPLGPLHQLDTEK